MHKRKDYYHAGGYNGKGLRKELEEQAKRHRRLIHTLEGIVLTNIKREPVVHRNEPPDNKPSILKRVANLFKGRTEA